MHKVIDHIRSVLLRAGGAGLSDEQLLSSFIASRDEAAFVALVRRHGRMVLGVCQRVLRNEHDAEDAFQATFLVLARKATSIQPRAAVGNWLYGVAYRTALEARSMNARRHDREQRVRQKSVADTPPDFAEVRDALDFELSRLPDKYRLPMVLCELEGRSRRGKEAARQLGLPEGTLSSRLATGRKLLAKRLSRYGFSSTGLAALVAESASAALPAGLAGATAQIAISFTAGPGAISATVLALAEGVMKSMLLAKLKVAGAVVLLVALVVGGAGNVGYRALAGEQDKASTLARAQVAQALTAQLADTEARLKEEVNAAEADLARAAARARELKAKLQDLQRRREEDSAVKQNGEILAALARRFSYKVPVEIGASEFKDGGHLEIVEVWGTRPKIEIGGQYLVRGKYTLPQDGALYFYETMTAKLIVFNSKGIRQPVSNTTLDLQTLRLPKGNGEFNVVHGMAGPGHMHLVLADPEKYSHMFANVYFGTGDNVLRKIDWPPGQ